AADFLPPAILWGDGTPTDRGTITPVGGTPNGVTFLVMGTHTYGASGTYATTATITGKGGSSAVAGGPAVIAPAPLVSTPSATPSALAGTLLNAAGLANFSDSGGPLPTHDYTATIDWGDGTPTSPGSISASGTQGVFLIAGRHNYASAGKLTRQVRVRSHGGPHPPDPPNA